MYSYNYEYSFPGGSNAAMAVVGAVWGIVILAAVVVSLAGYVMQSIAVHSIAKRRGIGKPWLAWLPVGREWIVGSLSDQYRYLVKGEVKSRRKILMGLSIATTAATLVMVVLAIMMLVRLALLSGYTPDEQFLMELGSQTIGMAFAVLVVFGLAIVMMVFWYMALYDVYRSCDPKNAVVFMVVGIVGGIVLQMIGLPGVLLEPILLLVIRRKDEGMPPRRTESPAEPLDEDFQCIHAPEPEAVAEEPQVEEDIQPDNPEPWEI